MNKRDWVEEEGETTANKEYCEDCGCPIEVCCAKKERLRTKKEIEEIKGALNCTAYHLAKGVIERKITEQNNNEAIRDFLNEIIYALDEVFPTYEHEKRISRQTIRKYGFVYLDEYQELELQLKRQKEPEKKEVK